MVMIINYDYDDHDNYIDPNDHDYDDHDHDIDPKYPPTVSLPRPG